MFQTVEPNLWTLMNVFLKWIVWTRHISLVVWSVRLTLNKYSTSIYSHAIMLALPQRLFCPFYGLQWKGVLRDMLNHHSYHHHWRSLDIINTIWSVESSREPNGACIKMIHRQGALVALKETLFRHKMQVQCNTGSYGYISFRQILQNLGFEGSSPQYWIRWWLC